MQRIEEFMRDLFLTRREEERQILANRATYRKQFFTPDCLWDSRRFTLEMIESEEILSIEGSALEPIVITQYKASVSPPGARMNRRRYRLKIEGNNFLIRRVESQCPYCHGSGGVECIGCKGQHWV